MKITARKYISLILSIVLIISLMFIFSSCSQSKKSVYDLLIQNEPDQSLAMIINFPKEEVISKVEIDKSLTLGADGDRILVIPKYAKSVIKIYSITSENGSYNRVEQVYSNKSTQESFVLDLCVERSDSNPKFKIVIYTPTDYAEYILFAAKGGDGSFEYIVSDLGKLGKTNEFSYNEMGYIFMQGTDYLKSIYGEPTKTETIDFLGDETATRLTFGESVFDVDNTFDSIYYATITNDKIHHPRGIKIGDSLPIVLSKFPNFSDGDTVNFDENDVNKGEYQLLYGEYMHMRNFGYIHYVDDIVTEVVYSNQGTALIFGFENNRVISVSYAIPLT